MKSVTKYKKISVIFNLDKPEENKELIDQAYAMGNVIFSVECEDGVVILIELV